MSAFQPVSHQYLKVSLVLFRVIGDNSNIAVSLKNSALAAMARGDHGRVLMLCEESLKLLRKAGDRQHIADCLEIMAGGAGALREEMGVPLQPEYRKVLDPCIAAVRSSLGETAWQAVLAEGRAMMLEQAIKYSLLAEEPATPPPVVRRSDRDFAGLTPREAEVAVLVSRGLTNRRVASELSISEHTVASHITKILKRLGLNSRSGLSAWVAGRGLAPSSEGDSRRY